MKAEADLHFLQGINQLIGHGWPYSPPSAGEPGWRFYAAAVFNDHNPWWLAMPEIAGYLQRVSFILRQGRPANDVALYLPTDDAWAGFTAGKVSVSQAMQELLPPALIPQILDSGYNFDFIDDHAIEQMGISYPVLVVPEVKRMPPATSQKLNAFKQRGGVVVEAARIAGLPRLFPPDLAAGNPAIGFIHRKLEDADIYFIANTSNHAVRAQAQMRVKRLHAEWWDPFTGRTSPAGANPIELELEPYESRVLVFTDGPVTAAPPGARTRDALDLSADWTVAFEGIAQPVKMPALRSWTEDESTRFFSGRAIYEKTVTIPASLLDGARELLLNFGEGLAIEPTASRSPGMRAWLESPVLEAAAIYINDQMAGVVWHPPYEIAATKLLHAGENGLRIVVGNLAINRLAGQAPPDYRLLNLRYGERFTPQDMNDLKPVPAGLLGPVRLRTVDR
jgi:hypothetical protein